MDDDALIAALDAHDESLLRHVDAEGHLSRDAARISSAAADLLDGRLPSTAVDAPEWYALASGLRHHLWHRSPKSAPPHD